MKTLILDFIGVVADINYKKMLSLMSPKQKFSALRIFASRKKYPKIDFAFDEYQKGNIDKFELEELVKKDLPNSAYVIPKILFYLQNNIIVNQNVLTLAEKLKEKNIQLLLMSNSTPETEYVMDENCLDEIFDGMILSTELGTIKPEPKIYDYAIQKFKLDTTKTLMIDDTQKNLTGANEFGISTIRCKNSKETCEVLKSYLHFLDVTHYI
ncbi:MAG: HAD-IA family hydrolase [Clostridia bacterium]|nr:HAD-IA family hydrolase [Clostridia bacterium]